MSVSPSTSTGKRSASAAGLVESDRDYLEFTPLGGGCEVGRSCHLLKFKGKTIMLDCGLHPAYSGIASLPYFDEVNPADIDLILITHFHLDHAAALPYFLEKTAFKGKVYMTHPTKSIYKLILQDYVKVSTISVEETLYTEKDLLHSMDKIECVNYHQVVHYQGIKFWAYNAGHVLGAAMFMIEISNIRILYTGDYSRREDRHLMAAEIPLPSLYPHILIIEATYGTQTLRPVAEREAHLCALVEEIVSERGGCCLIPVFALGRAQELLLILEEYWEAHPLLQSIPIYYASFLAKKCMMVYQTYLNMMNAHIQQLATISNPFQFKHIFNLKNLQTFDETQPCVILASPGMLQNGVSRELLEMWCTEEKNGVIIAGYAVEGTLAKHLLTEPTHITSLSGQKLPCRLSVNYISFSAHADYSETSEFIQILQPTHCILVHGDVNEGVGKLKQALMERYREKMNIVGPKNCQKVELEFKQTKIVKTVGKLAQIAERKLSQLASASASTTTTTVVEPTVLSGVIVKKEFDYRFMSTDDLPHFTQIHCTTIQQSLLIPFHQTFECLKMFVGQLYDIHEQEQQETGGAAVKQQHQQQPRQEDGVTREEEKQTDMQTDRKAVKNEEEENKGVSMETSSAIKVDPTTTDSATTATTPSTATKPDLTDSKDTSIATAAASVPTLLIYHSVQLSYYPTYVRLDWSSHPVDDMIADSLVSLLMNVQSHPGGAKLIGVSHQHEHPHTIPTMMDSSTATSTKQAAFTPDTQIKDEKPVFTHKTEAAAVSNGGENESSSASLSSAATATAPQVIQESNGNFIITPAASTTTPTAADASPIPSPLPSSAPLSDLLSFLTPQYGPITSNVLYNNRPHHQLQINGQSVYIDQENYTVSGTDQVLVQRVHTSVVRAMCALRPISQRWMNEELGWNTEELSKHWNAHKESNVVV